MDEAVDYSKVEERVLAHYLADPAIKAGMMMSLTDDELFDELRRRLKQKH